MRLLCAPLQLPFYVFHCYTFRSFIKIDQAQSPFFSEVLVISRAVILKAFCIYVYVQMYALEFIVGQAKKRSGAKKLTKTS